MELELFYATMEALQLPPELIREIILIFVESRPSHAAALATISRDVYEWIQPVLSKTLMFYGQSSKGHWPVTIQELPQWLQRNGKYVRNVMWGTDIKDLPNIISQCPYITNFAVWVDTGENDLSTLLPSLSALHLTHLSINLYELFKKQSFHTHQAQHDAFRTITHLDIFHSIRGWQDIEGVGFLPCLTHLCIDRDADVINHALQECKQLKALLVGYHWGIRYDKFDRTLMGNAQLVGYDDPRLVAVKPWDQADWECGAIGGMDAWRLADEALERRRRLLAG